MLLPVSVGLILLFDFITVPLSLPLHFYFAVWRTRCPCPCLPIWVVLHCSYGWKPFLPYAYYLYTWLSFVYFAFVCLLFVFCLSFVSWVSLLNPFLVTMSFAGYFHARFLLSAFFPVCLFCFVFLRPCSFLVCFGITSSIVWPRLDS